jgi:peptidoglycan/xylan/chitin deacetylase (PgdA/CDA1 family)
LIARTLKLALLHASKRLGLFRFARSWSAESLRILCYHGFALAGESRFRPKLFLEPETFARRLDTLMAAGFPVLGLESALEALRRGELPGGATVITVDDGFHSFYAKAWPELRKRSLPATVYITTYYAVKEKPVFRLVVQLMLWRTRASSLDVAGLAGESAGVVALESDEARDRAAETIWADAERHLDDDGREALLEELGRRLDVDYGEIVRSRILHLMTRAEIRELAGSGADVQLHAHRHVLPVDPAGFAEEVEANRAVLEPLAGRPLRHFCYPSGVWSKSHWPLLEKAEIASATTCDPGLNFAETPRFGLRRFVDGEDVSDIEFEAELTGYSDLLRRVRDRLSGSRGDGA